MKKIGKVNNFPFVDGQKLKSKVKIISALHKMTIGGYQKQAALWYNKITAAFLEESAGGKRKQNEKEEPGNDH